MSEQSKWAPSDEELFGKEWLEREKRREAGEYVPEPPEEWDQPTYDGALRDPIGRFWVLPGRSSRTDGSREIPSRMYEGLLATIMDQARKSGSIAPSLALRAVKEMRKLCDELEYEAVAIARGRGWSWKSVGDAIGVSASGAHRRFAQQGAKQRRRRPREPRAR